MSYVQDKKSPSAQIPIDLQENTANGPIVSASNSSLFSYNVRRVSLRGRLEKIGHWIVVAAGVALLLVLLGVFLPPIVGGMISAFYVGAFAGLLTLMNLSRPSAWGNAVLGRKVFPVLRAPDNSQVLQLAAVNALLMGLFTFIYEVIASFIGAFLGGLVVFGLLIAAAFFYSRVRTVVIKP